MNLQERFIVIIKMKKMFKERLSELRLKNPLINHITNPVSMNDCANAQLAIGASPMMTSLFEEIEDVAKIADGFNVNIGAIYKGIDSSMLLLAQLANAMDKPIILDTVGVGVSQYRKKLVQDLLGQSHICVLKGNVSEIKTIDNFKLKTRGVDVDRQDQMMEHQMIDLTNLALRVANQYDCIVVITGKIDVIADKSRVYLVRNGHPMMAKITGTGCVLSSLIAACISMKKASDDLLEEVILGVGLLGLAGEIAARYMKPYEGSGTYMRRILDSLSRMDEIDIDNLLDIQAFKKET